MPIWTGSLRGVKPYSYIQADGKTRKRWLRGARLVAREYANDRCDEVTAQPQANTYFDCFLPLPESSGDQERH